MEQAKLIRRYGAAVVVMAFDEQGQADTFARKTEICARSYRGLDQKSRICAGRHHLRSKHLCRGHWYRRARQLRRRLYRGNEAGSGKTCPMPTSQAGFRTCPSPSAAMRRCAEAMHSVFLYHCDSKRHGYGDRQRRSAWRSTTTSTQNCASFVEDVVLNRRSDATDRMLEAAERWKRRGRQEEGSRPYLAHLGRC